jgi:DedD protein
MAKKAEKTEAISENVALEQAKRRGRRRLVGAVILALFAVIFIPYLLKNTPEPTPPNDLNISVEPAAPQTETAPEPGAVSSEPAAAPPVEKPVIEIVTPPPTEAPAAEAPTVEIVNVQPAETQSAPKEKVKPAALPSHVAPNEGTYSVQVGAWRDDKGANAFAAKLEKQGFPTYTEPELGDRRTVWRVRVGAYKTKDDAEQVAAALRGKVRSMLVVRN